MAEQDACPHLDSTGEVTKEDLLQKSKVGFIVHMIVNKAKEDQFFLTINLTSFLLVAACSLCVITNCATICLLAPSTKIRYLCTCIVYLWLQGTCQSCGAGGPNLWACLQVKS